MQHAGDVGCSKRLVSSVDVTAPILSPWAQADAVPMIENHDSVDLFVGCDVGEGYTTPSPLIGPVAARAAEAGAPRARAPSAPAPVTAPAPAPACPRDADFCLKSQVLQQKVASR